MDSIKLAARCHNEGLISKEALASVLEIRERLIKEAIAKRVATPFLGRARSGASNFFKELKSSLGMGGLVRKSEKGGVQALEWPHVVGNLITLLGAGAALQTGAAGVTGLIKHRKDKSLKKDIESSYEKMFSEYPQLEDADKGKVARHFGVLARYAPSLAADPLVAGSWVRQTTSMGHIDVDVIKRLSDTQSSIDRAHEDRALLQPGSFGKGMQIAHTAMG